MRDFSWIVLVAWSAFFIGLAATCLWLSEQPPEPYEGRVFVLEDWVPETEARITNMEYRIAKLETKITELDDYHSGQSTDPKLETPKLEDFLPNETEGFTPYEPYSIPDGETNPLPSTGDARLDRAIERSVALAEDRSFAYNFSCGYEIDGILIHEGVPRYGQKWWGFAVKDRIVIREGLTDEDKMMVFAHELKHYERMQDGTFDRYDMEEEERLAYLYGWNESNWDDRILNHRCVG